MCSSDTFLAILAIFFPPISVWIKTGICTADSIINIALCCLGYVPGLLHAWYIILKYPEPDYDDPHYESVPGGQPRQDEERGHVTYYFISRQPAAAQQSGQPRRDYGTVISHAAQPSQAEAGSSQDDIHQPPTYAEAVKGDHKVQTHD